MGASKNRRVSGNTAGTITQMTHPNPNVSMHSSVPASKRSGGMQRRGSTGSFDPMAILNAAAANASAHSPRQGQGKGKGKGHDDSDAVKPSGAVSFVAPNKRRSSVSPSATAAGEEKMMTFRQTST
jgi:hypothetical protein